MRVYLAQFTAVRKTARFEGVGDIRAHRTGQQPCEFESNGAKQGKGDLTVTGAADRATVSQEQIFISPPFCAFQRLLYFASPAKYAAAYLGCLAPR